LTYCTGEDVWNRKAAISLAFKLIEDEVVVISGERESKKIICKM
jgi:hypothetical protein